MTSPVKKHPKGIPGDDGHVRLEISLADDYFRIRDFEYVQPLYDLAFLLEVNALAEGQKCPSTVPSRSGVQDTALTVTERQLTVGSTAQVRDEDLDYVPSSRIRQYLMKIRRSGTIPELRAYRSERFDRCLRLRSVRGLGPNKIALTVSSRSLDEEWFSQAAINLTLHGDRINELYRGGNVGPWQTAHIVPPLLRFMRTVRVLYGSALGWDVSGIVDPFEPVTGTVTVDCRRANGTQFEGAVRKSLRREKHFRRDPRQDLTGSGLDTRLGWGFSVRPKHEKMVPRSISEFAESPGSTGIAFWRQSRVGFAPAHGLVRWKRFRQYDGDCGSCQRTKAFRRDRSQPNKQTTGWLNAILVAATSKRFNSSNAGLPSSARH